MQKKVPVPINISLRWELLRGFGKWELIRTSIITVIVLIVSLICGIFIESELKDIVIISVTLFTFSICVGLFSKVDHNQSIYDYFKQRRKFKNTQRKFYYQKEKEVIHYVPKKDN